MSTTVEDLVAEWLRLDRDPVTRAEIEKLQAHNDIQELAKRMLPRITFGTAGLRARMEAGFSRMNRLTVIQTSQGLAEYLVQTTHPDTVSGVVIGYDGRLNSQLFAESAAAVFLTKGIQVWWFKDLVHTPLVPFGVRNVGAAAGIMITASHNPALDNGYKVYGSNGCQINDPADKLIATLILKNLDPVTWDHGQGVTSKVNSHLSNRIIGDYYDRLKTVVPKTLEPAALPRFVYTPMHGVGLPYMQAAVQLLLGRTVWDRDGLCNSPTQEPMIIVNAQATPDPKFSTVKYPNPEESGALDLAKAMADSKNILLVLANDPDADRFAAAEKVDGIWHQFSGDQVGVLIGYYTWQCMQSKNDDMTMLTSTVSSQMLACIGEHEGFRVEETLTGFKWIGNRALQLGSKAIYGYEEALGYMLPSVVYDKDGVAAAIVFLQACSEWESPWAKLQELYEKYGFFETVNTYWRCTNQTLICSLFDRIRHDQGQVPMERKVVRFRDMTHGFDTDEFVPKLRSDPTSQMVTFWLSGNEVDHGIRFTIRGSGTEPKIKIYLECRGSRQDYARAGALDALKIIKATWFNDPQFKPEEKYDLR